MEVQRFSLNVLKALYKQMFTFSPQGLDLARKTMENFLAHATRLYEQEQKGLNGPSVLGLYMRRWRLWTNAGVAGAMLGATRLGFVQSL